MSGNWGLVARAPCSRVSGLSLALMNLQRRWANQRAQLYVRANDLPISIDVGSGPSGLQLKAHFVVESISVVHLEREK